MRSHSRSIPTNQIRASFASVAAGAFLLERIDEENGYQRGKREGC